MIVENNDLEEFLRANGLHVRDGAILTPHGDRVGEVVRGEGQSIVVLFTYSVTVGDAEVHLWWPTKRRAWVIGWGDDIIEGEMIGPDVVVCDLCNEDIAIRPVPVLGSYALCRRCFRETGLPYPPGVTPYLVDPEEPEGWKPLDETPESTAG